jgi:hypothetical protein
MFSPLPLFSLSPSPLPLPLPPPLSRRYGVQCRSERAFDGDAEESTFCNDADIQKGDYFGIKLSKPERYESITVFTGCVRY